MRLWDLLLLAIALSMDALAVSLCKGCAADKASARGALTVGMYFGLFQALMPFLGYVLGERFSGLIGKIDHWVAFVLLVVIGAKMVLDARSSDDEDVGAGLGFRVMLSLAVATSIDAFAVGITFAALGVSPLTPPLLLIGATTFVLSAVGYVVGRKIGSLLEKKAEIVGGAVLMFLGMKILAEHLGGIG